MYFYDISLPNSFSAKLVNAVALSLLKELSFREDTEGRSLSLHFLKTKDGKEIDFLIVEDRKPKAMIEDKESDENPSPNFSLFLKALPDSKAEQWVYNLKKEKLLANGIRIANLSRALAEIDVL